MRLPLAATAVAGLAIAVGVAAAPAAFAANPTPLPQALNQEIASAGLTTQVNNGYEAVTGQAGYIDFIRAEAVSLNIGTVAAYTGDYQSGEAILIFTGNDNTGTLAFQAAGNPTFLSVANDTDQPWYVWNGGPGLANTVLGSGVAENITAGGNILSTVGGSLSAFTPTTFTL